MKIAICIPIYNDWASAAVLLERLDLVTAQLPYSVDVLLVDDGSSEQASSDERTGHGKPERVAVLRLRRNLGHQRAIAIGLAHLYATRSHDAVVVMDGDGEDSPSDVPALLERCATTGWSRVVFAQRQKRSEGVAFRVGYQLFRLAHRVLVGTKVEVGNFSVIPRPVLARLVGVSELWNHYAASVYKARLPIALVPTARGKRIAGESRMNFVALILHGLSAISVYSDVVGIRLLQMIVLAMLALLGGLALVVGIRIFTDLAIPGWATTAAGLLMVSLLNLTLISMLMALFTLRARAEYGFLPLRDYAHFVLDEQPWSTQA